jgi:hypothetical protein
MVKRIDPKGLQTVEIDLLDIKRRRFENDLILVIVLEPVGVFSIAAIRRPPRRFDIGHLPRLRTQDPEEGSGIERPCPNLQIIGLLDDASLICPESLQRKDQFLEIHSFSLGD